LVEAVSKSALALPDEFVQALGLDPALFQSPMPVLPTPVVAFTPLEEIERAVERRIHAIDFPGLARKALQEGLDRARGRV
jgi:hypothetical protein